VFEVSILPMASQALISTTFSNIIRAESKSFASYLSYPSSLNEIAQRISSLIDFFANELA
jgi:hypothetical protein